jgi:hemerythrin
LNFQWTDDLSVGVEEIDKQHKELIRRINQLANAVLKKEAKTRIRGILNYMDEYADKHFATEERYMVQYDYAGYGDHKNEHQRFKNVASKLKSDFEKEGASENFALKIQHFLIDWLILHLQNYDGQMGTYLKEKLSDGGQ